MGLRRSGMEIANQLGRLMGLLSPFVAIIKSLGSWIGKYQDRILLREIQNFKLNLKVIYLI